MGIYKDKFRSHVRTGVCVILPTIVICLVILEIGLRAIGRMPSNSTDGFYVQHKQSYRMKKDFSKLVNYPSYTCTIYTNSLGYRDRATGPRKIGPTPYFAFLGESLTFGNGVDYDQSFVGVFDELAHKQGFEALNLAIGGHGFYEQEELLQDLLVSAPQRPAQVVICFSPPFIRRIVNPYPDLVVKNGYVFPEEGWILPYVRIFLGDASGVYCFFRDRFRKIQSRFMSVDSGGMEDILENYVKDNAIEQPSRVQKIEEELRKLDLLITRAGAVPVYVYLPLSTDFDAEKFLKSSGKSPEMYDFLLYYALLEKHCQKEQIPLVNLWPVLKAHYEKGEKLNFMADGHYNVLANKTIAETIYESVFNREVSVYSKK
jgi:hypothetical protein